MQHAVHRGIKNHQEKEIMHNRLTAGNRMVEIQEEISGLLNEAARLTRRHGVDGEVWRADAYWIPHIRMALGGDQGFIGSSMCSMMDTAESFLKEEEEDGSGASG
jgi:hypothetical protein